MHRLSCGRQWYSIWCRVLNMVHWWGLGKEHRRWTPEPVTWFRLCWKVTFPVVDVREPVLLVQWHEPSGFMIWNIAVWIACDAIVFLTICSLLYTTTIGTILYNVWFANHDSSNLFQTEMVIATTLQHWIIIRVMVCFIILDSQCNVFLFCFFCRTLARTFHSVTWFYWFFYWSGINMLISVKVYLNLLL